MINRSNNNNRNNNKQHTFNTNSKNTKSDANKKSSSPSKSLTKSKDSKSSSYSKDISHGKRLDKASKYSDLPSYYKKKKNTEDYKIGKYKKHDNYDIDFNTEAIAGIDAKKLKIKNLPNKHSPIIKKEAKTTNLKEGIRLNKYIANAGICSRREADTFITSGLVSVNGKIITELGVRVFHGDEVKFSDEKVNPEKKVYILLNKPKDCVTTTDDPECRKTVMDIVENACPERIYPVGRLDRNTTGLLLLTNDGEMTKKLTHPSYNKKKIYHVKLDKPIMPEQLNMLVKGIELEDGIIAADAVSYVADNKTEIGIELHSGRNRVVRRMMEHFGLSVKYLDRVYYAGLTKLNLPRGKWRFLTDKEIIRLKTGMHE